jgi:hypothetical protein
MAYPENDSWKGNYLYPWYCWTIDESSLGHLASGLPAIWDNKLSYSWNLFELDFRLYTAKSILIPFCSFSSPKSTYYFLKSYFGVLFIGFGLSWYNRTLSCLIQYLQKQKQYPAHSRCSIITYLIKWMNKCDINSEWYLQRVLESSLSLCFIRASVNPSKKEPISM